MLFFCLFEILGCLTISRILLVILNGTGAARVQAKLLGKVESTPRPGIVRQDVEAHE